MAVSQIRRGAHQIGESLSPTEQAHTKNVLGILPAGQKFDDPDEPGPLEYYQDVWDTIRRDPIEGTKQFINDLFVFSDGE
ncbi:MAG: hypothetical protein ACFHX7_00250 [Pseudomonadota bacterium]